MPTNIYRYFYRSKHLYEIIYNRITTDLLLWEASAPAATGASANPFQEPPVDLSKAAMTDSIYTSFKMCQSGLQLGMSEYSVIFQQTLLLMLPFRFQLVSHQFRIGIRLGCNILHSP